MAAFGGEVPYNMAVDTGVLAAGVRPPMVRRSLLR
jgi:hypothetical protein